MISISMCMIIKNEEKVLDRCLSSVKDLFDEIIIVDTGSTDSSKETARKYTDKIYDYKWRDDFADARNYAFSKASCDYIYSADADEVITPENYNRFKLLKKTLLSEIEIVQMWYVNCAQYATTETLEKEYRPKLYKRLRTFTWTDPIHESVNLNPIVYDSDIEIMHMPISLHSSRDFGIFEKTIEAGKTLSPKLIKMYATELMVSGSTDNISKAVPFFSTILNEESTSDAIRSYCYIILSKHYRLSSDAANFFKWSMKSLLTAQCSEICMELGLFYKSINDYEEAILWFVNALEETEPILDGFSHSVKPCNELAYCYRALASQNEYLKETYEETASEYEKKSNTL